MLQKCAFIAMKVQDAIKWVLQIEEINSYLKLMISKSILLFPVEKKYYFCKIKAGEREFMK
jgi:hypothetical protein